MTALSHIWDSNDKMAVEGWGQTDDVRGPTVQARPEPEHPVLSGLIILGIDGVGLGARASSRTARAGSHGQVLVSIVNHDRTIIAQFLWANRGQDVGRRGTEGLLPKKKAPQNGAFLW